MKLRNKTTRSEETYCKYYIKKFRGYIRHIFVNYQTVGLFLGLVFISLLCFFISRHKDNDGSFLDYLPYILLGLFALCLICKIAIGMWYWKYAKHVVVTNEGIWIMWLSTFWWSKDFTGKKRLLGPSWSLYGWGEIKITKDDKVRPRSPVKLANFFDDFDYAVIKSSHLSSLFLTRWDGMQQIDFLDDMDANEILAYAREQRRRKKRKKKDMEIIEEEYDKLPDDEYIADDEDNSL